MKFYITEETKQEIEAKITELKKVYPVYLKNQLAGTLANRALVNAYEEILSSATILPVEESWKLSVVSITPYKQGLLKSLYKNGVIIQPKQ
jgi:hypothetical protein